MIRLPAQDMIESVIPEPGHVIIMIRLACMAYINGRSVVPHHSFLMNVRASFDLLGTFPASLSMRCGIIICDCSLDDICRVACSVN